MWYSRYKQRDVKVYIYASCLYLEWNITFILTFSSEMRKLKPSFT